MPRKLRHLTAQGDGPDAGVRFSVTWDLVRHAWIDVGSGVYLPEAFTATFMVEKDHTVAMDITVEEGVPVCNALRVLRDASRPSLAGHELRRIPIAEWVTYACSMVGVTNQGGVQTTDAKWRSDRQAIETVARRTKRRNTVTPELLRDVARVYRANAHAAPVEAVREAFGPMGHSTAARYVKLARDQGLLPKTSRGKVAG